MTTPAELIAQVRAILDEPAEAQWSDEHLRMWINEGNRDLARSTRLYKDSFSISTIAGNGVYSLDPSILAVDAAFYRLDGYTNEMEPYHIESFGQFVGYVREGRPVAYSTQGHSPNLTLVMHPVPDTSNATILLHTSITPPDIPIDGSGDSTPVEVPTAFYDALVDYCEMKALRRDRDQRWQEAYQLYVEKRDALIVNPDYNPAARGIVPTSRGAWLPEWLTEPGW